MKRFCRVLSPVSSAPFQSVVIHGDSLQWRSIVCPVVLSFFLHYHRWVEFSLVSACVVCVVCDCVYSPSCSSRGVSGEETKNNSHWGGKQDGEEIEWVSDGFIDLPLFFVALFIPFLSPFRFSPTRQSLALEWDCHRVTSNFTTDSLLISAVPFFSSYRLFKDKDTDICFTVPSDCFTFNFHTR